MNNRCKILLKFDLFYNFKKDKKTHLIIGIQVKNTFN